MGRDLPSLNAVRMFEAAARHRNFTRAADDLHVTQGAVSRQIKHLEEDLDQALFKRQGPKIELTEAGELLYQAAADALAILRRCTHDLKRMTAAPKLTISVLPSFAAKWLVPRITGFQKAHGNIDLRLAASYDNVDFRERPDIDLAIRFGAGRWRGVYSECLFKERLFPVCSPGFLAANGGLPRPSSLGKLPILHATRKYDQWQEWFEVANVRPPANSRGPRYSDMSMLLQAAIEGQGVALVRSLLAEPDIRSQLLVRPFQESIESRYSYYVVCPEGRENDPIVTPFLTWLRAEARASNAACDKLCAEE